MNNKQLYEKIMRSVSKEIKKVLYEANTKKTLPVNEIPLYELTSKEAKTVVSLINKLEELKIGNNYFPCGGYHRDLGKKYFGSNLEVVEWSGGRYSVDPIKSFSISFSINEWGDTVKYSFGKYEGRSKPMTNDLIQNSILYLKDLVKLRQDEIKEAQNNPLTVDEFYQLMCDYANTQMDREFIMKAEECLNVYYRGYEVKNMFNWKGSITLTRNKFNEYKYETSTPLAGGHKGVVDIDNYKEVIDDYLEYIRAHK